MMWFYIALGGALGSVGRFAATSAVTRIMGHGFPYGTMVVNIVGSLAMGMLIAWLAKASSGGDAIRHFVAVGMLGGFTTFSAFSLDVVTLFERGETMHMMWYMVGSITLSVLGLFMGMMLMRTLMV